MFIKTLTRSVAKVSGTVPLRIVLVVPFIIQITATVGIVGWLSFRNGQKAVNDVATQLRSEITARIQERLQTYVATPHLVNELTARTIELNQLNLQDSRSLERYFWKHIQSFPPISVTYIGTPKGEFFGARRAPDGKLHIELAKEVYGADKQGNRTKLLYSTPDFDPRVRPWYIAAVKAGKPTWSPFFSDYDTKQLNIAAIQPVYDRNGSLIGVLGSEFLFDEVNKFLHSLKIGKSGQTFIIDRSGMLVSTSTLDPVMIIKGEQTERIPAIKSKNPLIRSTTEYLLKRFINLSKIEKAKQLDFVINGKHQFLQVTSLQEKRGLDLLIVVVVPEADFMEQINANNRTTILLCLAALVIATLVGIATSTYIVQPILRLKDAATALSKGQFDQTVNLERSDELGVLAKAFNNMANQLQESFTTLETKHDELQRLNQQLQRFDKLKDEFLANTSHELRTPLNGIIGIAESLIDGVTGKLPGETVSNLVAIASSGRRLSHLINDILDFSKLKNNQIELRIKPLGIRELTDVVLTLSQPLIGQKSLQLINSIGMDTPLVDADENRLQQILHNLIGNALKFTESGVIEVSAELVSCRGGAPVPALESLSTDDPPLNKGGEYLAIIISDTGIGIPEDKLDTIFESFEQADGSTARVYGGTGLGLAVTKKLVELHGGTISVESRVGEGSRFTFTLPVSQQQVKISGKVSPIIAYASTPQFTNEPSTSASGSASSLGNIRVLVVDDDPVNLQVLVNNLSLQNYSITQAGNGLKALALMESGLRPDLILLDVMMPRMTGYEVCRRIRESFPANELPIVLLTAKDQISDLLEGFDSGANDYLTKPVSKQELLARMKTHIQLSKIHLACSRFVPGEFLRCLEKESIIDVKLGDQTLREMTILSAKICSFMSIYEGRSPKENFEFINAYLSQVCPAIRQHNGFIDKYIGDSIMALFPETAEDAIAAAITMQQQVALFNSQVAQQSDYPEIAIGIGIHTGSLMLGTIGEEQRMESTVISDAVHLATHLEELTKLYGASIIVSEQTLKHLAQPTNYCHRLLSLVKVKGNTDSVAVFEIYEGDSPQVRELKNQTRTQF
jgi:signal transduction histidine kinase/class 3 adenylate cyclase/ActR/RegA family two-component response regulator